MGLIKHRNDWTIAMRLYYTFHEMATPENLGTITLTPEQWLELVRQVEALESGEEPINPHKAVIEYNKI